MEVVLFVVMTIIVIITLTKGESKPKPRKPVVLYIETMGEEPEKMYLAYVVETHEFVCQAHSEKELHGKIFGVYGFGEVTIRDESGTVFKITFSEPDKI